MEIREKLSSLATKILEQKKSIETEEATKNAFVMPFISQIFGYDVFNPQEVVPEFTADVGIKKGEKVDYAIVHNGAVQILIECKHIGAPLSIKHASQLFRYFGVTHARIAILTNGDEYQFFTDLDAPNKMDEQPFLILKLTDLDPSLIPELLKMTKDSFDIDSVVSAAEELKYIGAIKRTLSAQFADPDSEWVKGIVSRVYDGPITQKVRTQFTGLVQRAGTQFLSDRVNDRLKAALGTPTELVTVAPAAQPLPAAQILTPEPPLTSETEPSDGIQTTLEELEAFHVVKAIACSEVPAARVTQRDTKSYFGVLLDDNNRKPIARLHFNSAQHYLGLLDSDKNETRHPISSSDEIYAYAEQIRAAVRNYA